MTRAKPWRGPLLRIAGTGYECRCEREPLLAEECCEGCLVLEGMAQAGLDGAEAAVARIAAARECERALRAARKASAEARRVAAVCESNVRRGWRES